MLTKTLRSVSRVVLVALLAFLSGCGTIAYRQVQDEFAAAVAADNEWSVSPFGINAAKGLYESIRAELTDDYIADLDPKLQSNAWLLRAVSEWRTSQYDSARKSAGKGKGKKVAAAPNGSRDQVMLTMLDGLVIDSDLRDKFRALPLDSTMDRQVNLATYNDPFHNEFVIAIAALDQGFAQKGPGVAPDLEWYYRYQRWRLMQNLRFVANEVDDGAERKQARKNALDAINSANKLRDKNATDATKLGDAMDSERDKIPADHPFRKLIEALSQ